MFQIGLSFAVQFWGELTSKVCFWKGAKAMIIPVIVSNGSPSVVNTKELDELLQKNALLAFRRSDGWVRVGFDDMRDPNDRRESSWKDRKTVCRQRSLERVY